MFCNRANDLSRHRRRRRRAAMAAIAAVVAASVVLVDGAGTQAQRSGVIEGLDVRSDAPGELTVSWEAPSPEPTDYRLRWAREDLGYVYYSDANEAQRGNEYPAGTLSSWTLSGLTEGATYKVQLRARYREGGTRTASAWTDEATATVTSTPDQQRDQQRGSDLDRSEEPERELRDREIGTFSLSSDAPGELTFSWSTPSPVPDDFRVMWAREDLEFLSYRSLGGGTRGNLYPGGDQTSFTLRNLPEGETYKAQMRARYGVTGSGPFAKTRRSGPLTELLTVTIAATPEEPQQEEPQQVEQPLSTREWIELNVIDLWASEHPWLHESWYRRPVQIRTLSSSSGNAGEYHMTIPAVYLRADYLRAKNVILHELAHHYTLHNSIYRDNPQRKLGATALLLYMAARKEATNESYPAIETAADYVATFVERGCDRLPSMSRLPVFDRDNACAVLTSVNDGEIPQWFLDTYTTDNTLDTVDLDAMYEDLKALRYEIGHIVDLVSGLFGGLCSKHEGTSVMWVSTYFNGRRRMHNPYVDGGCVNRRPQALTAQPGAEGEIEVTWEAPLYKTTPSIDLYAVQWKTGDESYDSSYKSTRQGIMRVATDYYGESTYTISGLDAGTDYQIRVAAVSSRDPSNHTDHDGRVRSAETSARAGEREP